MDRMEEFADSIHAAKHRLPGETFREGMARVAAALTDNTEERQKFKELLLSRFFLPAGRIQLAAGSPQDITLFNCFVGGTVDDSMEGIMHSAAEVATTMRKGGGNGTDFSTIRPQGSRITTLDAPSSGAVSFMDIHNSVGKTISSAGNRRGAQMGVLRVDHPDIELFVAAKTQPDVLSNFNLSVAITDEFMHAVEHDLNFALRFGGVVHKYVKARALFDRIMRATWDWAEPGVLFIDTINRMNNLAYCETIAATNPCGEQPLPPYGACLLGSINLTQYTPGSIRRAMPTIVRAMDMAIDVSNYPLEAQAREARNKRRMGIGVTGLANYIETAYGHPYGSHGFLKEAEDLFQELTYSAYEASIGLAEEKGAFPLFDADKYLQSPFIQTLPKYLRDGIRDHGIRNSHLISFAPAGTISLTAGNVSSGIEPVFSTGYTRTYLSEEGEKTVDVQDYAFRVHGVRGQTADQCSIKDHLSVLALATKYSDSAVSKTVNIGSAVDWTTFKDVYMRAWKLGCKGVTTFRADGKRFGILKANDGEACYINEETGQKECS